MVDRTTAPLGGDSVIYQNWLMKRSQMTRVFKRRFTILTANGKLYSFRKADLSKPETLIPANASLVWDIRGCIVELSPRMGTNTWVLKPSTSSPLREEIFLRTCSACPIASCIFWMQIMSAVAKNNLPLLYEDISVLTIQADVKVKADSILFIEIEGTLYPITSAEKLEIPLRSTDPGSCMLLLEFSPGNETPDAVSEPIPRYKIFKSKTTLPWTVKRPHAISLRSTGGGSLSSSGTMWLSVDEGLRDYMKPLVLQTHPETDSFDFAIFKFQIKRLIRIIDAIGDLQRSVASVFEWEDPSLSIAWFIYSAVVLLIVPRYIAVITLLHFALFSLSRYTDFVTWWDQSSIREKIDQQLKQLGLDLRTTASRPRKYSQTMMLLPSPLIQPRVAANPQSPSERGSGFQAAAASAISAISKSTAPPPLPFTLKPEIWENQRRNLGGSQFSASNLSVFDRSRWSDESGKVALDPPSSTEWRIDIDAPKSDDNGWTYNTRWGAGPDWHAIFSNWDFVRRRKWIPSVTIQSPPASIKSPPQAPLDSDSAAYLPAPVSAIVTSGAEYGHIEGDYDETNAQHQPKVTGLGSMFTEFKSTAAKAQFSIGDICSDIERWLSLFSWRDELVSTVATAALVVIAVALFIVPMNVVGFAVITSYFHQGYRRSRWRRVAIQATLKQHVLPLLPDGVAPNKLGGIDAHRLCLAINKRTGLNLTQKLLADMEKPDDVAVWICKHSPAFANYRKWLKRDWIENFIDHIPPEVSPELQVFLTDSSKDAVINVPVSSSSSDENPVEISLDASLVSETL